MFNRRVISTLCALVLAPCFLLSAVASREPRVLSPAAQLTGQSATLIINEYLADPPGSIATDLIGDANGDGVRDSSQDEFVELVNNGAAPLDISLFTISDATQTRFTFPSGKVIPPGESAVVFGGGTPTGAFGNAAANRLVFAAGGSGLSLNNGGDKITIKDNTDATVTSVTYGSTEGNANQSITRSPDVTGGFVMHSTAQGSGGALFSPGSRVNGAPFTTTDPVIASISPDGVIAGSGDVTIVVIGMNFHGGAEVRLDGTPVFTALFSDTELDAVIPASVRDSASIHAITVRNPNGDVSNSVNFTVLGQIGINEYLADPPAGPAGDANGDGTRDSSQDEFVEIVNRSNAPIAVGNFSIRDADAQRFVFPSGTSIPAGEAAVIFGGGNPKGDFGNARANGLVFIATLSLNNTGDTIILKDVMGATVESVTFGSAEGGAGQSINRNPDVSGIGFATHSSTAGSGGRLFSPGTQLDGSPFTLGPRIASIAPDNAKQGDPPFDMKVTGSNFEGGSQVLIDGQPLTTAFVSTSQIIGHVPATLLATSGLRQVQVRNEGGNRSNAVTLTIIAPPPSILSITPRLVSVGGVAFTLFLTGANFVSGAVVLIDGTSVTRTFVSSHDMRATVPASFAAAIGTHQVVVVNPDGRQSNATTFEVVTPTTVIASILPAVATVGGPGFMLSVRGSNFKSGVEVFFDQTGLTTNFVSTTQLSAEVPASLISAIGVHGITAQNPGGAPSNESVFQVLPESPLAGAVDPPSVIAGGGDVTVTISGERFQPGAVVRVIEIIQRGARLSTTFISSQQLQAVVPAALTQSPGVVLLGVENPDTGLSNGVTFRVLVRDPLVINEYLADPSTGLAGDANGDGSRSSSQDEFVEILNRTAEPFDISGYTLSDADAVRHVFAARTILPPFEAVVVFGGGTPTGPFGNAAENHLVFKASTGGLSLNNGGDTITLQDAQGSIVQQITYTAAEGGAGQSINRDPDGDGATFSLHTNVAADQTRLFSPGTRAAGQTFTIKPHISAITPASVHVGSLPFALTVSGANFLPGAVVFLGDTALETVYRSDAQLEAQVSANLLTQGGAAAVVVKNPRGEISASVRLLIVDDPPRASRITPEKAGTGADNLEVSITGERFQRGAGVLLQGTAVTTRFVSSTSLVATVPGTFFAKAAALTLVVINADGNQSNALTLTVENGPLITRLSRSKIRAGAGAFELTVGGVAFKPGIVLFANDAALSTSYIGETSFTAQIPAELTTQAGVLTLQARDPDGGRSNTVKFKVVE
jgi:Lamin Tail Domain/IPT/TIG domain